MTNFFLKSKAVYIPAFLLFFLVESVTGNAQSYKWVKGGGSTSFLTSGLDRSERVRQMCTDDNGNVYATANMGMTNILADTFYRTGAHYFSNLHTFIASYNCNGTMRWAKLLEGISDADIGGIEYSGGSIYVTGKLISDPTYFKYIGYDTVVNNQNYSSYIARFDTAGSLKWIRFIGANVYSNRLLSEAGTIAVDGSGYIHNFARIKAGCSVTPTYVTTQPGTYDLKYDNSGALLGVSQVPALDSVWFASKVIFNKTTGKWYAILVPNNNYWDFSAGYANSALCVFKPDNTILWKDTTGVACAGGVSSLAYDGRESLYVVGNGQSGSYDIGGITVTSATGGKYTSIIKLDTNDIGKWGYTISGTTAICGLLDLTLLPGNKIAATGNLTATVLHGTDTLNSIPGEGQNCMFLIIDTGAHTIKMDQLHGAGFYDYGAAITSDKIGNVYVGGLMQNNIWGGSLTPYVSNGGNTDYFVMKYGYDCSCLAAPPPAASYTHTVTATGAYTVAFTYTGSTGYDSVRWDFGDGGTSSLATPTHTYAGPGTYNACVTVYTSCGSNKYCNTITFPSVGVQQVSAGNIHVYPNPAHDELIVTGINGYAGYRLMSITGAIIKQSNIENGNTISLKDCAPGIYLLEMLQNDGTRNVVRVVKE